MPSNNFFAPLPPQAVGPDTTFTSVSFSFDKDEVTTF